MSPGDMTVVDSTKPSEFVYTSCHSRQLSLHLPRNNMIGRYGNRIEGAQTISRTDPLGIAMRSILKQILKQNQIKDAQLHVVESFFSVFGSYLLNLSIGERPSRHADELLYNRALDLMARKYQDSKLDVPKIASDLGVSTRKLQRAFKGRDDTPRRRLQVIRVNAVRHLIEVMPSSPELTVASAAFACGYNDLSTFYRQYKTHLGHKPLQQNST